jgi:polysaccharide export outer membrane protein
MRRGMAWMAPWQNSGLEVARMNRLGRIALRLVAALAPCVWVGAAHAGQGIQGNERSDSSAPAAQTAEAPRADYSTAMGSTGRAAILGKPRIGPNSELNWSVADLPGAPGSLVGGRATVDRNGRVDLGSFGSIVVAGLTPAEASAAIEAHVKHVVGHGPMRGTTQPVAAAPTPTPALGPVPTAPSTTITSATTSATKDAWAPLGASSHTAPLATPSRSEVGPPTAPAVEPIAYQVVRAVSEDAEPAPSPEPPPAPATKPASEPLPAPRVVDSPADEHLAPLAHGAGDPIPAPRELAMASLPPYVLDPPDVLLVESTQGLRDQPIRGQHLIRPDGTISLGIYGSVYVAGMTLEQARAMIAQALAQRIKDFDPRNLSVDVLSYNSKVYYVITDGGGYGEQVYRVPVTGSETVLDAISQINGLPAVASKRKIWVARRTVGDGNPPQVYPVDWCAITQKGYSATNYQVLPGDRIYVKANCLMRIDTALAKFLSPVQRVLGTTLLGGATVSSVAGAGSGSGLASTFIAR